jgi:hypothetical protein
VHSLVQAICACLRRDSNGSEIGIHPNKKVAAIPLRRARNVLPGFRLSIVLADSKPLAGD